MISDGLEDLTFHKRIIAATTVVVLPEKQLLKDGLSRKVPSIDLAPPGTN